MSAVAGQRPDESVGMTEYHAAASINVNVFDDDDYAWTTHRRRVNGPPTWLTFT